MEREQGQHSGFTYVSTSTKKWNKWRKKISPASFQVDFERTKMSLEASVMWKDCLEFVQDLPSKMPTNVSRPQKALCLGLGSPTASENSRAQLHLLIAMLEIFEIPRSKTVLYDPVFSRDDFSSLEELGFVADSENKKGKYALEEPTLVFMPHCGSRLYERVLHSNWSPEKLPYMLWLANDFNIYDESTPTQMFAKQTPCLAKIRSCFFHLTLACSVYSTLEHPFLAVPYMTCHPLPVSIHLSTAFNSLAFQYFVKPSTNYDVTSSFWLIPAEGENQEDGEVR